MIEVFGVWLREAATAEYSPASASQRVATEIRTPLAGLRFGGLAGETGNLAVHSTLVAPLFPVCECVKECARTAELSPALDAVTRQY